MTDQRTAVDWTDAERPAEEGTVYQSAAHESAFDEPVVDGPPVERTATGEPVAEKRTVEQPTGEGDDADSVDGSVPAGHPDPERALDVASVPDAEPTPDTEAGIGDRGDFDSPDVAAQDAPRTDEPYGAYGIEGHPADAPAAAEEQEPAEEHDDGAAVTETGRPMDGVDERADVADGEALVPVPVDDAAAPAVTSSGELLPGDLPEEPGPTLLDSETTERFRDRWQQLQLHFVDDPRTAAGLAGTLVDEVVTALRDAVDRRRSQLEDWQSGHGVDPHSWDTEQLRVAVRRYRHFLDRLLGL